MSRLQYFQDLLNGLLTNPKPTTIKIDLEYHKNNKFIEELTSFIIGQYESSPCTIKQNDQILKLALTTFNSLVSRFLAAPKSINDYFVVDEMFVNCKKILFCNVYGICGIGNNQISDKLFRKRLKLKDKMLVTKTLTLFLENSSLIYSEIQNLVKEANRFQALDALLIILQSTINSKIDRIIKIKSISTLFSPILQAIMENIKVVLVVLHLLIVFSIDETGNKGYVQYSDCFYVVEYWIRLMYECCKMLKSMENEGQDRVIEQIFTCHDFLAILVDIITWRQNISENKIAWVNDLYQNKNKQSKTILAKCDKINKLKCLALSITQIILESTSKDYNLKDTDNPLMNKIPSLCQHILFQIESEVMGRLNHLQISNIRQIIDDLNSEIISKMFGFLAQCVYFVDCQDFFNTVVMRRSAVELLILFLVPLDLELEEFENEPDRFANYLDSLTDGNSANPLLPRCAASKFIIALCRKVDGFTTFWFQGCFKTLFFQLTKRSQSNIYENITIMQSQFDNNPISFMNGQLLIGGETCLLGLLTLSQSILRQRIDLSQTLKQFIRVMVIQHFNELELCIFYEILMNNCEWIKQSQQQIENQFENNKGSLLLQYSRLISFVYTEMNEQDSCFVIGLNFIAKIYDFTLNQLLQQYSYRDQKGKNIQISKNKHNIQQDEDIEERDTENFLVKIYEAIVSEYIWPPLIFKIKSTNSIHFFQNLTEIASYFQDRIQWHQLFRVSNHNLLTSLTNYLKQSLVYCCQKLCWLYSQITHDELLCFKIHHSIKSLVMELLAIYGLMYKTKNQENLKIEKFGEIGVIIQHFIGQCLDPHKIVGNGGGNERYEEQCMLSLQEKQGMVEIAGILLQAHIQIDSSYCKLLFQTLINRPFCQKWLISFGYLTHQIQGKYSLNEIHQICQMLTKILHQKLSFYQISEQQKRVASKQFELQLNQTCIFMNNLLVYGQLEYWHKIHELVRIHIIKLMAIVSEKGEKNKGKGLIILEEKWKPHPITIIRLFNIYLYGYKIETNTKLLTEFVQQIQLFIGYFTITEAALLIQNFNSSISYIDPTISKNLFTIIIQILKKLYMNKEYFGQHCETKDDVAIRKLSQKFIDALIHRALDPYQEFKNLLNNLEEAYKKFGYSFEISQSDNKSIKQFLNIHVIKGEPRKLLHIRKR